MNEILGIIVAAILAWLNFVLVDTYLGLPEIPAVKGAENIGREIKKNGGDLSGGFFQGNLLCSPDASAGTLLASIGYMLIGPSGGFIAALAIFIGNRLCSDTGCPGTVGSLTIIPIIYLSSFIGLTPEMFVVGMVIAITTIQGIHYQSASKILGRLAKAMGRYTKLE